MAVEADRVVVELIAQTQGFDAQIKQSGQNFTKTMGDVEKASKGVEKAAGDVYTAHNKLGLATNNARIAQMEMQHVVRASVDQFAAGASATTIFAQHIASVAEAASFMGGSLGVVGEVLAGPWGIAVTAGVALLATFIARHHDASDSVEGLVEKLKKHHEQTVLNDQAQSQYDRTVEGSIEAMKKLTDEIDKQNLTLEDNIALKKAAIAGTLADVVGNIGTVSTQLAQAILAAREAQRILDAMQSGRISLGEDPTSTILAQQSRLADARRNVSDLTGQLVGLSAAAEGGAKALRSVDFPLVERNAKNAVNPLAAINTKYDEMADKAKKAGTYTQALANSIERMREADLKAAKQQSATSGEFGRRVTFGDAEAIARAAGLNVTSGYRSTAHQAELFNDPSVNRPGNPVARPGTSAHEGVNGKWALDIAFAPGLTAQSLKKVFGDEGVTLSAVFKEKGHFHIEGQQTQSEIAAQRAAEAQLKLEQRISDEVERRFGGEAEVTVAKGHQASLTGQLLGETASIADIIQNQINPALGDWDKQFQQIVDSMAEANRFGAQLVDDILDPRNWESWGDAGKRILHEILQEILLLGAANPLKNLLFGQHNPTLGSIFGNLFGGGSSIPTIALDAFGTGNNAGIPHLAGGGILGIGGNGGSDHNLLSINGQPRALVSANEKLAIIPSNAVAAAPGGGGSGGVVRVVIEASPYFDGRVMQVSGPVIAQASVAAAQGGASISRRNLGRESMHRLE